MNTKRNGRVREDGPALPSRRQVIGAGIGLAATSLLPRNIARATDQNTPQPTPNLRRKLGTLEVSAIGLGVQNMSRTYQTTIPTRSEMFNIIRTAFDRGITFYDAAEAYGPHEVERILGEGVAPFRDQVTIASKFGWNIDQETGVRSPGLNSRPEQIKLVVEGMLKRLRTDRIDLLYQHRVDPQVPIEDVAGAVKELMVQGKVLHWGLSEMGPNTLRRAHAALPVSAVQNEYSMLWRGPEEVIIPLCQELGIGFVPWSPLGVGFLTGAIDANTRFAPGDIRGIESRFSPENLPPNGAIAKNEPGKVNIHPVTYKLNGLDIVANVYTPANYDPNQKHPAIVVAHPNGGVKEQVAGLYAQHLAEQGYITITADAAYQGGSGGEPRNVDKPAYRIEDIHGMADFITRYPGVDTTRLGLFGICGGGGYSLAVAKTDKSFKSIATLSMFNSGRVRRNGLKDSELDTIQQRLQQASDARAQEVIGAEIRYAGDANLTDEQIAALPFDLYRQGYHYYWRTYAHPGSTFKYTMSSLLDLMRWDAIDQIELINIPLLMMAGSEADTLYMTEDAFAKATRTTDKELFKIDGAKHIETYWVPKYVDAAMGKLTPFFARTL